MIFTMTEEEILTTLQKMEANPDLVTEPAFRANKELWPDNKISFVETHLAYIKAHPNLDPQHYLSNLKLMLRRRP